jgi:SAM-dependent methyltransferase
MVRTEPGSFRDRSARVFYSGEGVYRGLSAAALSEWESLERTRFWAELKAKGHVVRTTRLEEREAASLTAGAFPAVLSHEAVPFISYPYEWTFGMLKDAGLSQLEILSAALAEDFILKDASAFNTQWIGARPVFIDIASFERVPSGEPWAGYRQFCQMFLYPLMLQAYRGVPFQPLLRGAIDGIPPEICNRLLSTRDLLRAGVFSHVFLQARLAARYASTSVDVKRELKSVGFHKELIRANVQGLLRLVAKLERQGSRSEWSEYANDNSYTDADQAAKQEFVATVARSKAWSLAWDIGCNTGTFSRIAASGSKYVVAMDFDELAVERLYRALRAEGHKSILPLCMNLADPSPNLGWRGLERLDLAGRGRPDLVLCLALIHHLVISANIPMDEAIGWLASLGASLVIEFPTREDPMVKRLLRNKRDVYADYDLANFERRLADAFVVERRMPLESGTRVLYFATPRRD